MKSKILSRCRVPFFNMGNTHKSGGGGGPGEGCFRDSYRLGRKLGEGAFGVVHECTRRTSGKKKNANEEVFAVAYLPSFFSCEAQCDSRAVPHWKTSTVFDRHA